MGGFITLLSTLNNIQSIQLHRATPNSYPNPLEYPTNNPITINILPLPPDLLDLNWPIVQIEGGGWGKNESLIWCS